MRTLLQETMNWLSTSSNTCPDPNQKSRRLWVCLLLLLALSCSISSAQRVNLSSEDSQYARESWGERQGFPDEQVTAFAQTADGYLWVGTKTGLIRFDGFGFSAIRQAVPQTFKIGAVQALKTDSRGNLWILLGGSQILRFHDGKFELGREGAEFGVSAIGTRRDGTILLASLTGFGTLTFNGEKYEVLASQANNLPTRDAMVAVQGDDDLFARFNWAVGVAEDRVADSAVTAITETTDGKIWMATPDRGFSYLLNGRSSRVRKGMIKGRTTCLLPLGNGEMWVGTDKGVLRWDGSKFTETGVPDHLRRADVHALLRDRNSNIWVGSAKGLVRADRNGLLHDANAPGNTGPVTALFEDREGNIWVGRSGSIERLRATLFASYPIGSNPSDSGGPIYVDEKGRAWFAPLEGSLHWREGTRTGTISNNSLSEDVVYSIAGQKDEVWIGRQRGGLTRLVTDAKALSIRTYTETDGLAQNSVYAVYESQDGTVWSGTLSNGVSQLKDGHFRNYTTADGLASNMVSSIAEGADGSMWFGTPKGLSGLAKTGWRNYTVRDGLLSPDINCLLEDSTGVLWIGTAGGLAFLRDGLVQTPGGTEEWLREPILGMAEDRNGGLWVSTSSHVLRAKRSSLTSGHELNDSDFRLYSLDDGLLGTEGVKRFRSVVSDSQGNVWFSTNRGLSIVNPALSAGDTLPASPQIVGVKVDGTEVRLGQPIQVPPGARKIVFDYVGVSLANPARIRYRYRLEGFDRGWSEVVSDREATFANLSPGTYRFKVICSNSDGIWNTDGASMDLSVLPTFYQTNWFRLLCLAGFLALLWGVYQLRIRQLERRFAIGLEARVDERTRIARELHDTLLQSFQGLTLHFQRARNLLPGRALEAIQTLDAALDGAEHAIVEGRDAIHDLRSPTTAPNSLEEEIKALGEELVAKGTDKKEAVEFRIVIEGSARVLRPDLHIEIFRIAREAARNAFSHSQGHLIETEIAYTENLFRLRIRDDGKGIDPNERLRAERTGHWGLKGMRERAEHLGGEFEVWSEPGAGTEIDLRIAAALAYEKKRDGRRFRLFRWGGRNERAL
jgi:signal transduction histidine kinase/ligand-binding sensor domain-containing protein